MSKRKTKLKKVNGIQSFKVRSGADEYVLGSSALASNS